MRCRYGGERWGIGVLVLGLVLAQVPGVATQTRPSLSGLQSQVNVLNVRVDELAGTSTPVSTDRPSLSGLQSQIDALDVRVDALEADKCGNGMVETGEECDWTDLNGQTCASLMQGFVGGTLACTPGQCTFDTSGCSAVRFKDNGDGTITDFQTGLMWEKKDAAGSTSLHDQNNVYPWRPTAITNPPVIVMQEWLSFLNGRKDLSAKQSGFAGYTDWRIPTIDELQTIIETDHGAPFVNSVFNTGCIPGCTVTSCSCTGASTAPLDLGYWSSSTSESNPPFAFSVNFINGVSGLAIKSIALRVRAVRGEYP